jgi:actin-related protein
MYEQFMETVQVPAFFLGDTSVLSLYATGRVSGICVDIGASHSTVSHIDKGTVVGFDTFAIGGDRIDHYILSRVPEISGSVTEVPEMTASFSEQMKLSLVRKIKHNGCKCSHHPLPPISPSSTQQRSGRSHRRAASAVTTSSPGGNTSETAVYKLPDNTEIDISSVTEYAAELLFTQTESFNGLGSLVSDRVKGICETTDPPLVVLTGGSSHFHGLHTRIVHELEGHGLLGRPIVFPFTQWTHRNYSGFVGASMLASLSTFASLWITPTSYSENGVDRIISSQ